MEDFYEIDFLQVESSQSGDAIPLRYRIGSQIRIHVTDGGFQETGDHLVAHINKYYGSPSRIDAVIVSHPDGDHAGGLRILFEEYQIEALWMLRPWLYVDELIDRFSRFTKVDNLKNRLKEIYPNIAELEDLAEQHDVPIYEPFQGARIDVFTVLGPTKERYLDSVVESEKTPESSKERSPKTVEEVFRRVTEKTITFVRSVWGKEIFPEDDTSSENNMSVVQYAKICDHTILLTADAGRAALKDVIDYAPSVEIFFPGIYIVQVPHHGSRHNVSTEILDNLIGPRLSSKPKEGEEKFKAIISAAKKDEHHPRKSVIRAFIHRGARVNSTEGNSFRAYYNAPNRTGWGPAKPLLYPEDQEQ